MDWGALYAEGALRESRAMTTARLTLSPLTPLPHTSTNLPQADWGALYDEGALRESRVPMAAAIYYEDMYVDLELSLPTIGRIRGLRQWVTSEYKHSGIRDDGGEDL